MLKKIGEYIMDVKIGAGAFGEVFKATKYNSKDIYAIKVLNKKKMSERIRLYLDREIEILQEFDNEHVIHLETVIQTEHNYYLVFDYCNGGDLLNYKTLKGGQVKELPGRQIIRQVIKGLSAIYELHGIHRDIKLGNVLLHYPTEESRLKDEPLAKICDFGFARIVENDTDAPIDMSIVGTPLNMSPEILQLKPYTIKSDMWSLGTIVYELVCGKSPFPGSSRDNLAKLIVNGTYRIPKKINLSTEVIEFLTSCLQYEPENRANWKELMELPFFKNDTMTPFQFAKFKENNPIGEDKLNYLFNSKSHYNFSDLYPKKVEEVKKEEIPKEINPKDNEEKKNEQINFVAVKLPLYAAAAVSLSSEASAQTRPP